MNLDTETGKLYKTFGLTRQRGLVIYNHVGETVTSGLRLMKVSIYLMRCYEVCNTESERLYATYLYGWMFGRGFTKATVDRFRLEFGPNEPDKSSFNQYDEDHHKNN